MSDSKSTSKRVSLSKAQIQDGIGAELFSLCQGMTADGRLSKEEIIALRSWLRDNKEAGLSGIEFLASTLNKILADGRITPDEQRELIEAVEKVLPPDARKTAKTARKAVETQRKAMLKAAKDEQRRKEREREEKRWPDDEFDFMVAGVHFEGRDRVINKHLNVGDRVRLTREHDNPQDEYAVAIRMIDGQQIGYVPRDDSPDVSDCIDDGGYYVATVKKILTGGRVSIPVILLHFYRHEQFGDIADLAPDASNAAHTSNSRKPWWKFW